MTIDKPVAIIPARGGSKRLPRKNLMPLAGKPLIAHTIETALTSKTFARVLVSTEDDEIANVARQYGAEVPFLRPPELASDTATNAMVVLDALQRLASDGEDYASFALLQPTSPLRTADDIRGAYKLFVDEDAWFVLSIVLWEHPPFWAFELQGHSIHPYFGAEFMRKTQELPALWRPNGAMTFGRTDEFRRLRTVYTERTLGYEMPIEHSIDIDTDLNLLLAESIMARRGAR